MNEKPHNEEGRQALREWENEEKVRSLNAMSILRNGLPVPQCNCEPPRPMKWSNKDECYFCDECEATAH